MSSDNRLVVLLKSIRTLNRFYTLASPDRGWKNAEEIEDFPNDVVLGIAYPCLEDGLNDFAVIRSTFETIDCFSEDEDAELRDELMVMVVEARDTLHRRLSELRDRLKSRQAHFLGTDLREFKEYAITLATKGNIRRTLDNMMKLDVYKDVAARDAEREGKEPDTMYYYQFRPENALDKIRPLAPLDFVVRMFNDVLEAVEDEASYQTKYTFDKEVFQKFIALMFVNYATTDPIFYGTNKADYGVSLGRDMSDTPLYKAVGEALREIERRLDEFPNTSEEDLTRFTIQSHIPFDRSTGDAPGFADVESHENKDTGEEGISDEPEWDVVTTSESDREFRGAAPSPSDSGSRGKIPPSIVQGVAMPPNDESNDRTSPNGRWLELPNASTAEQRILVPLNSITMAAELLKGSGVPMASTYAQMILAGADALKAALQEWGVLVEH